MTEVVIAGIGQTPVGEHMEVSLRTLAARAIQAARADAGGLRPQAMYIGNFLASVLSGQSNLGALFTSNSGLEGIEGVTVEAAGASGAAAFRMAYLAVLSGFVDTAIVVGAEKCTDVTSQDLETAMMQSVEYDYEVSGGLTLTAQAALLTQRYMHEYDLPQDGLAEFSLLAHANAVHNPNAMYRRAISPAVYQRAGMVSTPLNMFDVAPYADGAAAVILTRPGLLPKGAARRPVRVVGSSLITDSLALHDRHDLLAFRAAELSVERACRQTGILPGDVDFFELFDAFTIYALLSLEAAGFARHGEGWKLGRNGKLALDGELPISVMGGLKGRGRPVGATGVYQIVEAVQQLRGQAGENQIPGARRALVQALGGAASTAVTHVLSV
ncbi:MAG: thiolase domain-containing protein [Anaerolineaceae bacterium]|nr:thiolase domain-containing protein [Anaerolineaceae bacterium]